MSSVGYYNTYYQQQSQTYTVPVTGCEHKGLSGCNKAGHSPKCCYCNSPPSLSTGLAGDLSSTLREYCPPCKAFWARKIQLSDNSKGEGGPSSASSSSASASAPASASTNGNSSSAPATREAAETASINYFSRLSAPFSSVPYIPQSVPKQQPSSPSRSVSAAATSRSFQLLVAPQNASPNAKKRPRPDQQHKHSSSESSTGGSYKRSGGGEGSSAGSVMRAEQSAGAGGRSPYGCPAVRAINSRSAMGMGMGLGEADRRWTLAGPYGVPGAVQISQSDAEGSSNGLRPAGTSANSSGGFQTYKPPSPPYPTPNLSINTGPSSSSRSSMSYQNYKPPKGPSYQPYRPGSLSTPTSPNDTVSPSSSSHLHSIAQPREARPNNNAAHIRSNSASTPVATITTAGNTIITDPPARNPSRNMPETPAAAAAAAAPAGGPDLSPGAQGSQNRTPSSLRLGDNTISTRSDSAPRAGVPIPPAVERFRTRSWDGAPIRDANEGSWAAELVTEFLPPPWATEAASAAAAAAAAAAANTPNSGRDAVPASTPAQAQQAAPAEQAPSRGPQNNGNGATSSPTVESSAPRVASQAGARTGMSWLDWSLTSTPAFPGSVSVSASASGSGSGSSAAPAISWGSGDTRRNTVAGPPGQGQDAAPVSPRRKLVLPSRTLRPSGAGGAETGAGSGSGAGAGQLRPGPFGVVPSPYRTQYPPPMETAIPPHQTPPVLSMANSTGGWPLASPNAPIQRNQDLDVWSLDSTSASFFGLDSYQPASSPANRREQPQTNSQDQQPQADRREIDINSRWGVRTVAPAQSRSPARRGTGNHEPRVRRNNRSPQNHSPQDGSLQHTVPQSSSSSRSPRQRARRSPQQQRALPNATPPLPLSLQFIELAPAPAPQIQTQPPPQPRAAAAPSSSATPPVIPPIVSISSSPAEEWETWDQAAWTAAASEIAPAAPADQADVGKMAEDASVLLELFCKTKPRRNGDIGADHREMIENAYRSVVEIRRALGVRLGEGEGEGEGEEEVEVEGEGGSAAAVAAEEAAAAAGRRRKEEAMNADDCIVCFSSYADTVLLPCKHMVLCGECCDKMKYLEQNHAALMKVYCPVCRAVVDDRLKIYRG